MQAVREHRREACTIARYNRQRIRIPVSSIRRHWHGIYLIWIWIIRGRCSRSKAIELALRCEAAGLAVDSRINQF